MKNKKKQFSFKDIFNFFRKSQPDYFKCQALQRMSKQKTYTMHVKMI